MIVFLILLLGVIVALWFRPFEPLTADWRRYTLDDADAKKLQAHLSKE